MLTNNYMNMYNTNVVNPLIPSPTGLQTTQIKPTLGLNQIENFIPVQKFTDAINTEWTLIKNCIDSTVDVPDHNSLQIIDYWNHEFPNLRTKLYVYVVEGVRQPRVETEQPKRILYQWFSTYFVPSFTPDMITEKEWLKANVYAAPIINDRVSKLRAICHITDTTEMQQVDDNKLITVEEFNAGATEGNTEQNGTGQ